MASFFNLNNKNDEDIVETAQNYAVSGFRIIKIREFKDTKIVADLIKEKNIVTFTLENVRNDEGQRVIDYLSGATYVLGGVLQQVTDKVYSSIPAGMNIKTIGEIEE